MQAFKCAAAALALASTVSASAMRSIADADLSQVSGQDGIAIIADLSINIGSFTYIDNNGTVAAPANASVSFNNIDIKGMIMQTIDVLTNASVRADLQSSLLANGAAAGDVFNLIDSASVAAGYAAGSDVVRFAFPATSSGYPGHSVTVSSITTGNGGASVGGIQINQIDMQGTKIWMFGRQ